MRWYLLYRLACTLYSIDTRENFCDTNEMKFTISKSLLVILAIFIFVGTFVFGITIGERMGGKAEIQSTVSTAISTNENKVWSAIKGLNSSYDDPYKVFSTPKESKSFADETRTDFDGIGIAIGIKDKVLTVIAILKGTPAERAGLKSGNSILKIDKKFTAGITEEDAVSLIRGPKGTNVTLTIKENGDTRDVVITRDTIIMPTIETKLRDDGVFVISLYNFSENSPELFRAALSEFILSESDKLLLDLNNNLGDNLEAATVMANYFLPSGKTVVIGGLGLKSKQKNVSTDKLKTAVLIWCETVHQFK